MPETQPHPDDILDFDAEFQQELDHVEQCLIELKQRYAEIQTAELQKTQFQDEIAEIRRSKTALPASKSPVSRTELRHLQKQLEALEVTLESRLLTWSSFKEPFWQIIRFGGLGIVLGWILHNFLHP